MEEFLKKVDECYANIHDLHDTIKGNEFGLMPSMFLLAILEAKGIITREEQEALKSYVKKPRNYK